MSTIVQDKRKRRVKRKAEMMVFKFLFIYVNRTLQTFLEENFVAEINSKSKSIKYSD